MLVSVILRKTMYVLFIHIKITKLSKQCQKVYLHGYVLGDYRWWWRVVDFVVSGGTL